MKNSVITLFLLVFSFTTFAQDSKIKEISGTVTYLNEPLKDVNITIKGTEKGTKTNETGQYEINANVGDELIYSYVGFENVSILIEDVTSVLNIVMDEHVNKLDEVVIETNTNKTKNTTSEFFNRKVQTSIGNVNPMLLDGTRHFSRDRLATQYRTLSDALKFYYPKGLPTKNFDVDGILHEGEPYVDMATVQDIYFVPRYPTAKLDPLNKSVIIVRTTNSEEYREITTEKHRNQNYYDNDALSADNANKYSSEDLNKTISGKVTHLFTPIPNVNITIKGTSKGTKTDSNGDYTINAKIGDILEYSHVSYQSVAVLVEDITSTLNIELQEKKNELDEVVVIAEKEEDLHEVMDIDIKTPFGVLNPLKSAGSVHYLNNKEIARISSPSLEDALSGRFSRVVKRPDGNLYIREARATYNIDGIEYKTPPALVFSDIVHLFIIKEKATIVIRTKSAPEEIAKRQEEKAESYRNQNYYSDDALATNEENTFSSSNLSKEISGKVTHLFAPVPNVNITIKGTSKGSKTNDKGEYTIQANVGDILEYSHVGFQTVAVMVEDVTTTLNIELQEKENKLDEVVVKARKNQKALEYQKQRTRVIKTGVGEINLKAIGFAIDYSAGDDLPKHCDGVPASEDKRPLECAAAQKFPFINRLSETDKPPIWDIDGVIYDRPPFIPVTTVEHMWFLPNAPARYGNKKVIIVHTIGNNFEAEQKREEIAEQYRNQNYYNADAVSTNEKSTFSSANINTSKPKFIITKEIRGKVTYLDAPMPMVNIKVVGKNAGVVSSTDGTYSIKANVGDIIQYSHVGFATVSVIVEDITEILDIEMVEEQNELETVIVTADSKQGETAELAKKADKKFKTSMGNIDPKSAGYSVGYIDGDNTTAGARDILDVLDGKVAGVTVDRINNVVKLRSTGSINTDTPPLWDVDGNVIDYVPNIPPDDIKDIHLLKSLASTTRYGSNGRGGVIVVTTKSGSFDASTSKRNKIAEQYTNKDYYANDASQISLASLNANTYADGLEKFPSKQKAYIYYDEKLKRQLPSYVDHLAIAQKFVSHFNDLTLSTQIFKEQIERNSKNPEVLKAIAFHLQTIGRTRDAIEAYENTFKLRPQYAQSYRDLANAYMENDQFKKSWRLYMSYLLQGKDVSSEGIGELIYNEMEWLYFSRRNQTDIRENFVPKSENLFDFRNDVRIIVEWNSSEAEFDLEFVNPELRSYVFEHTLAGNQELITDEKQKGYSSKEFFIDDLEEGEWLVNITYKGNKKPEPTYFKITKFYNWGKATQSKEVAVYKFQNERDKIQLMRFHKDLLASTN